MFRRFRFHCSIKLPLALFKFSICLFAFIFLSACTSLPKPDFDRALAAHLQAVSGRDLAAIESQVTQGDSLFAIMANGHAFTTAEEFVDLHRAWFKDGDWIWAASVVRTVVGEKLAMALVKYSYQENSEAGISTAWLVYVFQLEGGQWRLIHDQNTAIVDK